MSYPDTIHARDLRQGDCVYTARGACRRVLATHWRPGWSFIHILVEGENARRSLPIGRTLYVRREAT